MIGPNCQKFQIMKLWELNGFIITPPNRGTNQHDYGKKKEKQEKRKKDLPIVGL